MTARLDELAKNPAVLTALFSNVIKYVMTSPGEERNRIFSQLNDYELQALSWFNNGGIEKVLQFAAQD